MTRRLASFKGFPHATPVSPISLAQDGFERSGNPDDDRITCSERKLDLSGLISKRDVSEKHRRESPSCQSASSSGEVKESGKHEGVRATRDAGFQTGDSLSAEKGPAVPASAGSPSGAHIQASFVAEGNVWMRTMRKGEEQRLAAFLAPGEDSKPGSFNKDVDDPSLQAASLFPVRMEDLAADGFFCLGPKDILFALFLFFCFLFLSLSLSLLSLLALSFVCFLSFLSLFVLSFVSFSLSLLSCSLLALSLSALFLLSFYHSFSALCSLFSFSLSVL